MGLLYLFTFCFMIRVRYGISNVNMGNLKKYAWKSILNFSTKNFSHPVTILTLHREKATRNLRERSVGDFISVSYVLRLRRL